MNIRAREAGLTAGGYFRLTGLGDAGPRAQRAPTVDAEMIARAVAALNKVGSNLNQIARMLNSGQAAGSDETTAAIAEVRALLAHFRNGKSEPQP